MTRKGLLAIVLALAILTLAAPARAAGTLGGRTVALDPGHSESNCDTGAQNTVGGTTIYEKDVNWEVVVATAAKLQALGATVVVLRGQDECVDRSVRYQRAANAGAQVLLSVHHNGSSDPTVNYTITYYTQKSDQKIAKLAQQHLVARLGFADRGTSRSGFGITVRPKMPSALTEAWFLTNDQLAGQYLEEQSQGHPAGSLVDREAQGLTDAVVAYFAAR